MASWDLSGNAGQAVDFRLVHNSFVTIFRQPALLDETVGWLRAHSYDVTEFDASSWTSASGMLDDVAEGLRFPDYFGRNMHALNDCMRDVGSAEYGWDVTATGLVLIFRSFDVFAALDRQTAQTLLHIVAHQARGAILVGNRLICLVQSNDPKLAFEPVGAMPVMWNDAEWRDSELGR